MPSGAPETEADQRLQRAIRSLRGLSIGDAVGRALVNPGDAAPVFRSPPWRFTDDTEMAIAIVEALATFGTIDQPSLAASFAKRFSLRPDRGYGAVAHWILTRIAEGMPWQEAASTPYEGAGSKGNGAAMRIAPLGAYFADAPDLATSEAVLSAAVTHAHPQGHAGAVAVAFAATLLARNPRVGISSLRDVGARVEDRELRDAIQQAASLTEATGAEAGRQLGTGEHAAGHAVRAGPRVTLRNRAVDDGVSRAHSSFTLQSDSGPKFPASPVSAEVDDRCTTTWLLRRGDEVTCRLAFEIPLDAKPTRVVYEDPDSTNAAEAEVTVTTPECIPIAAITSGNAPYDCVTCYNATQCVTVTASIECLHALSACGNSGAPTCSTCDCEHDCLNGMASCISDFESCVTASCATECAAL